MCRPVSAPAQVSQQVRGVSDPARVLQTRPQGRPAGSLTPRCQCQSVLGRACVLPWECCARIRGNVSPNSFDERTAELLRFGRDFPAGVRPYFLGVNRVWFAVAPVPSFPGGLGRVKGPLRRCAPLTHPARFPMLRNYRSDGHERGSIPGWLTNLRSRSRRTQSPESDLRSRVSE